jgi:superfamily II DNA or RNA helicase
MDPREGIQNQAKEEWLKSKKATIILGTGMGKSKVAIDIIKQLNPETILLLTNSETLRDSNWKAEFEKFEALEYWNKLTSECYQTVHRWKDKHFSLTIADEIDFSMTESYVEFFKNNTSDYLLGLTGFCTEDKREMLNQYAPTCFEYTTQQGQEDSLLNKSEVIFIEYDLSKDRTISVMKKDKKSSFATSENDMYKYWDKEFIKATAIKSQADKAYRLNHTSIYEKKAMAADWKFKSSAAKRKAILNNLDSSVKVVKSLIDHLKQNTSNKALVFSALTNQADKFGIPTFHGKENSTEKDLNRFLSGEIRQMAVCKGISRGVNLPGTNFLIKESFDGSETDFQQTHGRLTRLEVGQVAKYIVLIPYFSDMIRTPAGSFRPDRFPTQQLKWANKMMSSFDITSIRYIRMNTDYSLPTGILL